MMLKPDQERVRTLLRDTITLLCKNGLSFKTKFSIDAVIGVTLDEADAFYVSMNQVVAADKPVLEQDESNSSGDETEALYKQKRKRRGTRHKQSKQIKVEDKQTISIPEDSQHNDMVEQFDDSEGDNSEDASNLSGTFKVEIDESNKDIVFIKQEIEHGESWQETVRGSTSFQASDSNYSGLDASQDGGRNWMQGSQQANLEQSPNTSAALGTSQQLSHVQPVMGIIKKKKRLECKKCNKTFGEKASLKRHEEKQHLGTKPRRGLFPCDVCGRLYVFESFLQKHQKDVHLADEFRCICNNCGKEFSTLEELERHMVTHTGIKKHQCSTCGKTFSVERYLKSHVKVHNKRDTFQCPTCGKVFDTVKGLNAHEVRCNK